MTIASTGVAGASGTENPPLVTVNPFSDLELPAIDHTRSSSSNTTRLRRFTQPPRLSRDRAGGR